ncbi:MAG: hypothetical protein KGL39_13025 [Patescibacteria group bacterium]|nr:hypothetical protein [Patescibacteria group bacterium]
MGKTSTQPGPLALCANGLHYCERALDCYQYAAAYKRLLRFLRVTPLTERLVLGDKSATLNLHPDAELTPEAWLTQAAAELDQTTTNNAGSHREPRIVTNNPFEANALLELAAERQVA